MSGCLFDTHVLLDIATATPHGWAGRKNNFQMDDSTKRNEGRGNEARAADVGTEPKKLSAQCNGLLARASEWRVKIKTFWQWNHFLC